MKQAYVFGFVALVALNSPLGASAQEVNDAPHADGRGEAPHDHRRAMVGAALGGALGVVVTYALSGGVATYLLQTSLRDSGPLADDEGDLTLRAAMSLMVSLPVMPALSGLAIWQGGRMAGGQGNYWVTLLGTSIGGIIGGGSAALIYRRDWRGFSYFGALFSSALQYAGGLIAYHITDKARAEHDEPRLLLEPSVTPSRFGLSLGLGGRF